MIYILYSKSEIKSFKIWHGHLRVVEAALLKNQSHHKLVDCDDAIGMEFLQHDVVINFGNHQYLGSTILNGLSHSLRRVGRTVFFMDDYQAPPATQMRKAVEGACNLLITNISEEITRNSLSKFEKVYLNLNKASWNPQDLRKTKYPGSFIYWGSYRKGREDWYSRYFKQQVYRTFVSSSNRGHDKFFEAGFNYTPRNKLVIPIDLQDYGFTVYMRDVKQPAQSPANRFYEAVSAGLPIFFDRNCIPHVEVPERVYDFVVNSAADIEGMPNGELKAVQTIQRKIWGKRDYRQELINDIAKLFNEKGIV